MVKTTLQINGKQVVTAIKAGHRHTCPACPTDEKERDLVRRTRLTRTQTASWRGCLRRTTVLTAWIRCPMKTCLRLLHVNCTVQKILNENSRKKQRKHWMKDWLKKNEEFSHISPLKYGGPRLTRHTHKRPHHMMRQTVSGQPQRHQNTFKLRCKGHLTRASRFPAVLDSWHGTQDAPDSLISP